MNLFKKYKICPHCHKEIFQMPHSEIYYCPECCVPRVSPDTRYVPRSKNAAKIIEQMYHLFKKNEKGKGSCIYRNKDAQIYLMGFTLTEGRSKLKKKYHGVFVENGQIKRTW